MMRSRVPERGDLEHSKWYRAYCFRSLSCWNNYADVLQDDLGMSRREFVSANLVSEDMDTIDTPLTMQQIEARRKVNQAGTEESNISAAKKNSLSSWNGEYFIPEQSRSHPQG